MPAGKIPGSRSGRQKGDSRAAGAVSEIRHPRYVGDGGVSVRRERTGSGLVFPGGSPAADLRRPGAEFLCRILQNRRNGRALLFCPVSDRSGRGNAGTGDRQPHLFPLLLQGKGADGGAIRGGYGRGEGHCCETRLYPDLCGAAPEPVRPGVHPGAAGFRLHRLPGYGKQLGGK